MKTYLSLILLFIFTGCEHKTNWEKETRIVLNDLILQHAEWAMQQMPETITATVCERSAGSIHDFYSEGDYWWPDPQNPENPYIRRDGETNPENFVAHRLAMIRFSKVVGYLASAYLVTNDESYVIHAFKHIHAWFVDPATKMNPNLLFGQAIKGIMTGRGFGIIDTIHLMEVAQGILRMQDADCVDKADIQNAKNWFAAYLDWLLTHPYGIDEMNTTNNHTTWWHAQVSSFAKLTGNAQVIEMCRTRYKEMLLPRQMSEDGSFPEEISRTKPYSYSLFNIDALVIICRILSCPDDNLWEYTTDKGINLKKGIDFIFPYIQDKSLWPYPHDTMHWDDWPVAQPFLVFAAEHYNNKTYFNLWKKQELYPTVQEVERTVAIRNPLIWM
ncbi:MAG: alginate lyase family protein [Candidatus Symbiothrix sp.]|jgi:hypothetical protein|nr:alginate lyase family protein [Candidatus Symbiothrix sp.]